MGIALTHLAGQTIGVLGLARSGLSTLQAAAAGGAKEIYTWDDNAETRKALGALPAIIKPVAEWPWTRLDLFCLSPGIPLTHPAPHPAVELAGAGDVEIICDLELLFRQFQGQARFVAVTGTNGKSTTTALIGHILARAGYNTIVGGNIGTPILDLDVEGPDPVFVMELSSYQLDLTRKFQPDVAVWLNLTPDHLDRHGDLAGYRKAKERIFRNMRAGQFLVLGVDEADMVAVADRVSSIDGGADRVRVRVRGTEEAEVSVDASGKMIWDGKPIADLSKISSLRGVHNWQNAACAFVACRKLGVEGDAIVDAMNGFPGLAHRMEVLGQIGKVMFVNDSKATNAEAAARSLATFQPVYWIAGGLAKEGGIGMLQPLFGRIAKAYLIGEAADIFSQSLSGQVPHLIAGDLQSAVDRAYEDGRLDPAAEPAILLAPAAASFDQFADFEARGEAFRVAFNKLMQSPNPVEAQ